MEYKVLPVITLLAVVAFAILIVAMKRAKKKKVKIDYRSFFIMGLTFLPMGIIFSITINPGFFGIAGLGFIYIIIGLINKDKWKKPKPLSPKEKEATIMLFIIGIVLLLLLISRFFE